MNELRIGLVGTGSMGSAHIKSLKNIKNARLTAICDCQKDVVERVAKENNISKFYENGEDLFRSGEVDAVIIATPHRSHGPLAAAAFEAGLHVLSEKPIAVCKEDAQKMIDAHKKHPELKFAAMFQFRAGAVYRKIKQLIESGELGKIKRFNWIITNWFRTQLYFDSGSWRATWNGEGGGVLLNQCPHQLDLIQWLFGMPAKVRAFCHIAKFHNIEVEDDVTAYLEYKSGTTGVFVTSTGDAPGTNRLEISAERGRLVYEAGKIKFDRTEVSVDDFVKNSDSRFGVPETWNIEIPYVPDTNNHFVIMQNFVDCILDKTGTVKLIALAEEGINSVELANSMLYSSMKDVTVELPLNAVEYSKLLNSLVEKSKFTKKSVIAKEEDFSGSLRGK